MDSNRTAPLQAVLFVALVGLAAASSFISGDALVSHGYGGRSLLQEKTECPVSFQYANYTIITSKCKGPLYPPKLCCDAFKEFACPYADELNDATNDCASVMFAYIYTSASYPSGLFASECRDDKKGLICPANPPRSETDSSSGHIHQSLISVIILVCGIILRFLFS